MLLLIAGIGFIAVGIVLRFFPPKNIGFVGYRTGTSMKNQDTWMESQKYSGKLILILGILYTIIGGTTYYFGKAYDDVSIILQFIFLNISLIGSIATIEIHLSKIFDRDGNRKA